MTQARATARSTPRLCLAIVGSCALAQLLIAHPVAAQLPVAKTEFRKTTAGATAEEILAALRRTRPSNEVIPSDSRRQQPVEGKKAPLLPEGFRVSNFVGTIVKDGDWWRLNPIEEMSLTSIRLLPNRILEQMVHTSAGTDGTLQFAVSGELTVFQDENFLFPRVATRWNARVVVPSPALPQDPASTVPVDASTDSVLSRLRLQQPEQEILEDYAVALPQPTNTVTGASPMESVPMTQRPGRLWGQDETWTFILETSTDQPHGTPLRILPNQHLERMIAATTISTVPMVFNISGEITEFEGNPHLFIRAASRRSSSGDLGK